MRVEIDVDGDWSCMDCAYWGAVIAYTDSTPYDYGEQSGSVESYDGPYCPECDSGSVYEDKGEGL